MPLQKADEEAFTHIANNPKLREKMLQALEEDGYTNHPAVKEHIDFNARLEAKLQPYQKENEELRKRLDERDRTESFLRQRDSVRKGPFNFNDEKIKRLEERMKDKDAPVFVESDSTGRTAYQQAALYFQHMDSPVGSSTFPIMDFTGPTQKKETWRELMNETDKTKNPIHMSRRERRKLGDKLWSEAKEEYMADFQNK